ISSVGEIAEILNTDTNNPNAIEQLATTIVRNDLGGSIIASSSSSSSSSSGTGSTGTGEINIEDNSLLCHNIYYNKDLVIKDIKYNQSQNMIIAGGYIQSTPYSYDRRPVILKSTNGGDSWSYNQISELEGGIEGIVINENNHILVAIGGGSGFPTLYRVMKSTDGGTNWNVTQDNFNVVGGWLEFSYGPNNFFSYVNGRFFITGRGPTNGNDIIRGYTSVDGNTWTKFEYLPANIVGHTHLGGYSMVAPVYVDGKYMSTVNRSSHIQSIIMTSVDGINWDLEQINTPDLRSIASNGNGTVTGGYYSLNYNENNTDTFINFNIEGDQMSRAYYLDGKFTFIGGYRIRYSSNGTTWSDKSGWSTYLNSNEWSTQALTRVNGYYMLGGPTGICSFNDNLSHIKDTFNWGSCSAAGNGQVVTPGNPQYPNQPLQYTDPNEDCYFQCADGFNMNGGYCIAAGGGGGR
ncbi:MAG: hypothetical protein Q8K30_00850, partial [Candidatus Gracilibacteria bacterium]|nr:hypothetical protein [Candidatus Gracilibacteria bacterium]